MKRVEIIANRSVEEDLMEALEKAGLASAYTKVPEVHGRGRQGLRDGSAAWPEVNFLLLVYCGEEEAAALAALVAELKLRFPHEGVKIFTLG